MWMIFQVKIMIWRELSFWNNANDHVKRYVIVIAPLNLTSMTYTSTRRVVDFLEILTMSVNSHWSFTMVVCDNVSLLEMLS